MKKTLLILAAALAVTSSAIARPCRGYRRPCRRPVVIEHHHKSHSWHSEDWGKLAAGIAVGWLVNEAFDAPARPEVVYAPSQPVYQPTFNPKPAYAAPPVYHQPVYQTPAIVQQPVYQTVTRTPSTTIVRTPYAPRIHTTAPQVTVINNSTTVQVVQPTTIVRQIAY